MPKVATQVEPSPEPLRARLTGLTVWDFPEEGVAWPEEICATEEVLGAVGLDPDGDWEVYGGRLWVKSPEGQRHYLAKESGRGALQAAVAEHAAETSTPFVVVSEMRTRVAGQPLQPDLSVFLGRVPVDPDEATTTVSPVMAAEVYKDVRKVRRRWEAKRARYLEAGIDTLCVDLAKEVVEVWRPGQGRTAVYQGDEAVRVPLGRFGEVVLGVTAREWIAGLRYDQKERLAAESRAAAAESRAAAAESRAAAAETLAARERLRAEVAERELERLRDQLPGGG